jgi:hypothetical protein
MFGVADRVWARVELQPGARLDPRSNNRGATVSGTGADVADAQAGPPDAAGGSKTSSSPAGNSEIREAWMRGGVALHQDPAPDTAAAAASRKLRGDDITGEALYLDNRGEGKVLARVYHHDPTEPVPQTGPMPLATVSTDDMTIRGEIVRLDQEHDKVWADGPGTLTRWTNRALLTDKAPEPTEAGDGSVGEPSRVSRSTAAGPDGPPGGATARVASQSSRAVDPGIGAKTAASSKARTRAGRPVGDRDLLTVTWTRRMEFTGRTTDTFERPAGRADFFGHVNAWMEDAQLKCDQKMVMFTDREVPLAQLGSLSGEGRRGTDESGAQSGGESQPRAEADLSLIYCYGNALGVSRKIDPDLPIVNQQQIIRAERELDYDHRTGNFHVFGPGEVYFYDRSDQSGAIAGPGSRGEGDRSRGNQPGDGRARPGRGTPGDRTVVPTSGRTSGAPAVAPSTRSAPGGGRTPRTSGPTRGTAPSAQPAAPPITRRIPPLVLTQISFTNGMRGRFGTGQATDTAQERWSEFFGDIQFLRAEVASEKVAFDFDQPLPSDGFFMTSQILRVIQEPPPPDAPASAPARSFAKAWDNVTVNKGGTAVIQSDVGTYDSASDQLYAYGEGNRGVVVVQQDGIGQPASTGYGKAVEFNVKSGAVHFINSSILQGFDRRTGTRPAHVPPPDPNAKPKKKVKPLFRIPNGNMERRGFTGQ